MPQTRLKYQMQVATTTDNSNVKIQFNSSLVFKILGFVQFWNKEVYGRYVKYMHLPCICPTSSQSSISKCMGLYYKRQRTYSQRSIRSIRVAFEKPRCIDIRQQQHSFPNLILWYLSIKVLASKEKKKTTEDKCECDYFFAIKMQTKNLALAQNARILPASPLRLRHSYSSAIPKAQKKARTNTNTARKQVILSV